MRIYLSYCSDRSVVYFLDEEDSDKADTAIFMEINMETANTKVIGYRDLTPSKSIPKPKIPETVPSPSPATIKILEVESGHNFFPKWIGIDKISA